MASSVHRVVVKYIQDHADQIHDEGLKQIIQNGNVCEIYRLMFMNYRGSRSSCGKRLTKSGAFLMQMFFEKYQVDFPERKTTRSKYIVFLEKRTTMPYYIDDRRIVFYETEMGIYMILHDGDLETVFNLENRDL